MPADPDRPFVDSLGARLTCAPAPWVAQYYPHAGVSGPCAEHGLHLCTEGVQLVPMVALLGAACGVLLCCLLLAFAIACERRAHGLTRVRLEERELDEALEVQGSTLRSLIDVLGRRLSEGVAESGLEVEEEGSVVSAIDSPRSCPTNSPSTPFGERLAQVVEQAEHAEPFVAREQQLWREAHQATKDDDEGQAGSTSVLPASMASPDPAEEEAWPIEAAAAAMEEAAVAAAAIHAGMEPLQVADSDDHTRAGADEEPHAEL